MKKIYYYINLLQTSPLRISSGDGVDTDSDLRLDRRKRPFIPGSSLTGVIRSYFEEDDARYLFGDVDINKSIKLKDNIATESRLIVSDAVLADSVTIEDIMVSSRDGIGLDDWGLSIPGAKYDFQVVEGQNDLIYHAVIECSSDLEDDISHIEEVFEPKLKEMIHSGIRVGARTSRGYGDMKMSVIKREFTFPNDIDEWLEYRPMNIRFGTDIKGIKLEGTKADSNYTVIKMSLKMKDSFNVRMRTTMTEPLEDGSIPKSVFLCNSKGIPVIPGTAWAGAFRHHMRQLLRECAGIDAKYEMLEELDYKVFGKGTKAKNHASSNVSFSEMPIHGGCANSLTRNAVERFTAAPMNKAVYTYQVWTGGEGELKIIVKNNKVPRLYMQLLIAAIYDLNCGLLSIGGEANIGRGIVEVKKLSINDVDYTEQLIKENLTVSNVFKYAKGEN